MSTRSLTWRARNDLFSKPWSGAKREYDLFKELTVGVIVVGLIVAGLSFVFGSPDDASVTLKSWAIAAPTDFVTTSAAELAGTSDTAGYGPPYNSTAGATQTLGPLDLQSFSGVRIPIDTANDFVIHPLATLPHRPVALTVWKSATAAQQSKWANAYVAALAKAPGGDPAKVQAGDYGPVPALTRALLGMAKTGALDGAIQGEGGLFNLDYTRTTLFLGDGSYFPGLATNAHITGDQWGMMNEIGNYPGQAWLWLFSLWYQIPLIGGAPNADVLAALLVGGLTLVLLLVPFIPGLRTLPRLIPLHRLVWKDYYRKR